MELIEVINKRHSVRKYKGGVISTPMDILEALGQAKKAPSAGGLKAYFCYVVGRKKVKKLAEIVHQSWISNASVSFVLCIEPEKSAKRYGDRGRNLYCIQDATLFGAYLDLLLVEKGYGTCWVGAFRPSRVSEFLKIPKHLIPISLLVVGNKDENNK